MMIFFRRGASELELQTRNPYVVGAFQGVVHSCAEEGTRPQLGLPPAWSVFHLGESVSRAQVGLDANAGDRRPPRSDGNG